MLGFTLSKFSLLILVVSIFSIVSFFTVNLTDSLRVKAVNDLLANDSSIASEMMSSPSYCDILLVKIPETIKLSASEMYYTMKISATKAEPVDGVPDRTYLIFSVFERNRPDRVIAASSSPTTAKIIFFQKDSAGIFGPNDTEIILDPSAESSILSDAFYLVKEVNDAGEVELYIFPCSISGGMESICEDTKVVVGKAAHPAPGIERFKCSD